MAAVHRREYDRQVGAHRDGFPGDPRYLSAYDPTRREPDRRAEHEARPEVRAKRCHAQWEARQAVERAG